MWWLTIYTCKLWSSWLVVIHEKRKPNDTTIRLRSEARAWHWNVTWNRLVPWAEQTIPRTLITSRESHHWNVVPGLAGRRERPKLQWSLRCRIDLVDPVPNCYYNLMLVAGDGDVLVAICRRGVQVQHAERKRGGSGGHGTPAAIRATRRIQVHVPIILYTLCRALHGEFGLT